MIIIETCPKCGHDLHNVVITTYPPIPKKECWNCGWSWTGEQEKVVRVPFNCNKLDITLTNNFSDATCDNCPSNPKNGGSGICFCTRGQQIIY